MERKRAFAKELGSLEEIFAFLEECFVLETIGKRESLAISVVAEELFASLVKYNRSNDSPVIISFERDGRVVHLELVDRDVDRFDPASVPAAEVDAAAGASAPGGLGLHLVRAIVDRITFEYEDRVMRILVDKKLEPTHA
jgi:anti-sigma regulatory factor (Ser/Thr protein kinase)